MDFLLLAAESAAIADLISIAERLGIPTAMLFLGFFLVIRPLTKSGLQTLEHHRTIVDRCQQAQLNTAMHVEAQTRILDEIKDQLRENGTLLREQNGKLGQILSNRRRTSG